jgi:general secretion pathway protein D
VALHGTRSLPIGGSMLDVPHKQVLHRGARFGPAQGASATRLLGVTTDLPSFGAFIKLLQKNNDVNVLSAPSLLITNNEQGEIAVGQRLPFPSGFLGGFTPPTGGAAGARTGLARGVSVQREDISLRLKLLPNVNAHDRIRLDVDIEISDLAAPNFNGLGPATSKRTVQTPVVCRDQQTIVLGGLLADRLTHSDSKVPVLGDIPVRGFFFRRSSRQLQKSNIVIALTPYVINDLTDLRSVAERKLRERREFMERTAARPDLAAVPAEMGREIRRRPGMLERINRAARDIDREEAQMRGIREPRLQEETAPIEISSPAVPMPTKVRLAGSG